MGGTNNYIELILTISLGVPNFTNAAAQATSGSGTTAAQQRHKLAESGTSGTKRHRTRMEVIWT